VILLIAALTGFAQTLTVNKDQSVGGNPVTATNVAVGVPIVYTITISSSSSTEPPTVNVTDTLPLNFVVTAVTCSAINLAVCATIPTSFSGPTLTITGFNIPQGGTITLTITGHFTMPNDATNPYYTNEVVAQRVGEPVELTADVTKTITIPANNPLPVDIGVTKSVTPATGTTTAGTSTGTTYHYTIIVTNHGPGDVYLDGFSLTDLLTKQSGVFVYYALSNFTCTGSPCPTLPPPPPLPLSGGVYPSITLPTFRLHWDTPGFFPNGNTITILFDAVFTSPFNCGTGQSTILNKVFLSLGNTTNSVADTNPANNTGQATLTSSYSLSPCPPSPIQKLQLNPPLPNPAAWGTDVLYSITITNTSSSTQTNLTVNDYLWPLTVPVMHATLTTCSATSPAICPSTPGPSTLIPSFTQLFSVSIPSLAAGSTIVIKFTIKYDAPCDTDTSSNPLSVVNYASIMFLGNTFNSQVITLLNPLPDCGLTVTKTVVSGDPVVLGTPTKFKIVFQNPSTFDVWVATLLDSMSLSSSTYGNLPFTYGVSSCQVTTGTVSPTPTVPVSGVSGLVSFNTPAWNGVQPIHNNGPIDFSPGATLECTFEITPTQPAGCQGTGAPKLLNSALMSTSILNPNVTVQPAVFAQAAAALPLCRNVTVQKDVPNPASTGPGGTVTFTIRVINNNLNDPVSQFLLDDPLQAGLGFTLVSASCTPATACNPPPGLVGGNVQASILTIPPGGEVDVTIVVKAPVTGGSYTNLATGEFQQQGNFFVGGGVLQNTANVQVLTPHLTKSFNPATVSFGSNATLTFTITNVNSDPAQTGITFLETLPAGLVFNSAIPLAVSCLPLPQGAPPHITAAISGNLLTVTGGLAAGVHTCTVTTTVTANGCGALTNGPTNIQQTANIDPTGATATLQVINCPSPLNYYQYSAKFVCGVQSTVPYPELPVLVPGVYYSAINVHNPTEDNVRFCKKFVTASPGEQAGPLTQYFPASLGQNRALEIDCADIYKHTRVRPNSFLKGFAVIVSPTPLNVVVVYTGGTLPTTVTPGQLATMDVETVAERRTSVLPHCWPIPFPPAPLPPEPPVR
jgi:uncharacterized repeat protein (TIGR01451 family)